jgi:hydroxyacylglutathione hydrolase
VHVVTEAPPSRFAANGALEVAALPAAEDNLVWVLGHPASGEAVIIDGPDAEAALAWIAARGLRLAAVWNTHTHGDHVGVNLDLARRGALGGVEVVGCPAATAAIPGLTTPVDEGAVARIGDLCASVLRTDGHLTGHVSYLIAGHLFCGDTLFGGGCGFLFDRRPDQMFHSLMRLAALPPDTLVCCAHEYTLDNLRFARFVEPDNADVLARLAAVESAIAAGRCTVPSTIAVERATNPFLRPGSPALRRRLAEELPEAPIGTFAETFAATRALKDTRRHRG